MSSPQKPPWRRILEAAVTPPVDGLDTPPAADEGCVASVDLDYVRETALDRDRKACQACHEPVSTGKAHVRATVFVDGAIGPRMKTPVFCDQRCWAEWAGSTQ